MVLQQDELEWPGSKVIDTFFEFFEDKKNYDHLIPAEASSDSTHLCYMEDRVDLYYVENWTNKDHTFYERMVSCDIGSDFCNAIENAWILLTKEYKIATSDLYATYSKGNKDPLGTKSGAIKGTLFASNRMFAYKDNFEMGNPGPCLKIYFNCIGNGLSKGKVSLYDIQRSVEICSIVLSEGHNDQCPEILCREHVTTAVVFERLAAVLQGNTSSYDSDVFVPIFNVIHQVAGADVLPYSGRNNDQRKKDNAYRFIADQIRTLCYGFRGDSSEVKKAFAKIHQEFEARGGRIGLVSAKLSGLVEGVLKVMIDDFDQIHQKKVMDTLKEGLKDGFASILHIDPVVAHVDNETLSSEDEFETVTREKGKMIYNVDGSKHKLEKIYKHPRHDGVYWFDNGAPELLTRKGDQYIRWPNTSFIASGIRVGYEIPPMMPGRNMLWMGKDKDELRHISNVVGKDGIIYYCCKLNSTHSKLTNISRIAVNVKCMLEGKLMQGIDVSPIDAVYMDAVNMPETDMINTLKKVVQLNFMASRVKFTIVRPVYHNSFFRTLNDNNFGLLANYVCRVGKNSYTIQGVFPEK